MRGINRIVIIGRLGADPEARQDKNGKQWCTMSVATSRPRRDGEAWVEDTDWHDVRVFGDEAERAVRRLRKGSVVAVDGRLQYDVWNDEQGQRRRQPRIVASRVQPVADLRPAEAVEEATIELS